jgi:hypothetical protein
MENLYLIEYGCSICTEHLIVLAESKERANEFAYQEAQSVYWSYDCNYPSEEDCEGMSEEEIAELAEQDMEQDIQYFVELYDPNDEEHQAYMRDQGNKPYEI